MPPGDVPATAGALARVVDDATLRQQLSVQASVEVQRYLQSSVAARLAGIYRRLAG